MQEGNRWIARMESLLRRPVPKRGAALTVAPAVALPPTEPPAAEAPLLASSDGHGEDDAEHAA